MKTVGRLPVLPRSRRAPVWDDGDGSGGDDSSSDVLWTPIGLPPPRGATADVTFDAAPPAANLHLSDVESDSNAAHVTNQRGTMVVVDDRLTASD